MAVLDRLPCARRASASLGRSGDILVANAFSPPYRCRSGLGRPWRSLRADRSEPLVDDRFEHDGIVVLVVMGGIEERQGTLPREIREMLERIESRFRGELTTIAFLEFLPAFDMVTVPTAQLIARGDVAKPFVGRKRFFAHSAGPQPID
jgi:hypothetical protein